MDRNLRIRMLLEATDRVTRPIREMSGGASRASRALGETRQRLEQLNRAQESIQQFRSLKMGLRSTGTQLDSAQRRVAELAREIGSTTNPSRRLTREFEAAKRAAAALQTQHQRESAELQRLRQRMSAAGIDTRDLARHERDLRRDVDRTNRELEEQTRRLQRLEQRRQRMASARTSFSNGMNTASSVGGAGMSALATAAVIAAPVVASAKSAMNFEEGMAGVAKVTGLANDKLAAMADRLVDLSTRVPMSATDLSNIAAAAGAAGVGMDKFGRPLPSQAEDLVAFTDAAARMGIAFDMSAEDAGGTMAKWRQAFQMTQPEVEGLGDRINALTNKFGGKASAVSGIVTRIGPLGKVAGIAAPQVAALASSLNSIGVEEEVAATGIKNTLLTLTKGTAAAKSQQAAYKALGLDAAKVAQAMQVDASGTIVDVLERIRGLSVDKQASTLSELFGTESVGAIAPLLTNLDGLKERLGLVGDRSKYAGSMTAEFLSRINTTSGATDLAVNGFQAVNISLGQKLLPTVKAAAQWLGGFAKGMRQWARANPLAAKGVLFLAAGLGVLFGLFGIGAIAVAGIMGPIVLLNAGLVAMGGAGLVASAGLMPIIATVAAVVLGIAALAFVAHTIYSNWGGISAWFAGLWQGVKNAFFTAINFLKGLFGNFSPATLLMGPFGLLFAWFPTLLPRFFEIGRNLIQGLINGVLGMLGKLKSTIMGVANAAPDWFKKILGIHSPSRVFMGLGSFVMQGLDQGIRQGEREPVQRIDRLSKAMMAAMTVASPTIATAAPAIAAQPSARSAPQPAGDMHVSIHIVQQPGQSGADLARLVEEALRRIERERAAGARANMRDQGDGDDA